ncbi:hypothetical protein GL218_02079 [Daldinia childiae]|uniref:uncharacterized protein n=1 Tax=Daldinia childiae TaxID=326645 RepID=UPI00144724C3|nr:uncharacterized protein GL218_02079 [Daldinia childiae]KAF3064190.1 hypothetical protein GL218_02079 [Daldinia childiae]
MAALTDTEIEKLFSGAPQFFARSQGHGTGAPHPSIGDNAWGCVTAGPRIILRDPLSVESPSSKKRPHFNARCQERPNMLSMQGLEKGTIGYQAALEISVADSLQEEQYGFDSLGSKGHVIVEQRQRLITSKDSLRHLDDSDIMERLIELEEEIYQAERRGVRIKSQELYNELFAKVLYPPTRVIDPKDPYSLAVQIHALVKVLAAPNAWTDFSRVEWRIRLGQILWAFPLDDEILDGASINEGNDAQDRSEERYWLLLQILLSCELLIRLDAITEGDEFMLSHYLMSALLEVDETALARLGPLANLSGGFVYSGKSFWSTACIVGRVLAAGQGAAECMGWISSDVTPRGFGEGWVNIAVDAIPGDADPSSVLPADFIIPYENAYPNPPPSNIKIELKSLNLNAPVDNGSTTPTADMSSRPFPDSTKKEGAEIQTYPASVAFTMSHDTLERDEHHNFTLSNDVYFVTAHPCVASSYVKYFKSPTSPTIQQIDVGGHNFNGKSSSAAHITGLYPCITLLLLRLTDSCKAIRSIDFITIRRFISQISLSILPRV